MANGIKHYPNNRKTKLSVYVGQEINYLKVKEYEEGSKFANFACLHNGENCKKELIEKIASVLNGHVKSCGCLSTGGPKKVKNNTDEIELLLFHKPWT